MARQCPDHTIQAVAASGGISHGQMGQRRRGEGPRVDTVSHGPMVVDARLVADLADGYDVVVMGADKWHQLHDTSFYEDGAAMAEALSRLPTCAVAPRDGLEVPREALLEVPRWVARQSSTAAATAEPWTMLSAARSFGLWDGS